MYCTLDFTYPLNIKQNLKWLLKEIHWMHQPLCCFPKLNLHMWQVFKLSAIYLIIKGITLLWVASSCWVRYIGLVNRGIQTGSRRKCRACILLYHSIRICLTGGCANRGSTVNPNFIGRNHTFMWKCHFTHVSMCLALSDKGGVHISTRLDLRTGILS